MTKLERIRYSLLSRRHDDEARLTCLEEEEILAICDEPAGDDPLVALRDKWRAAAADESDMGREEGKTECADELDALIAAREGRS